MKTRDKVVIQNTNSSLDGLTGRLLGKSVNGLIHIWIVELTDGPITFENEEYLAITIPGSCLEVV